MRSLLAVAALVLLVAPGCGDDTTTTPDMAMSVPDMSVGADMAKNQTCAAIIGCIANCGANASCQGGCIQNSSTAAQGYFGTFFGCLVETCGPGDGGNGSCTGATDTSAGCQTCINTVGNGAQTAGNPCSAEFAACLSH